MIAEISLDASSSLADLASYEHSCAWCFETHRVQLVGLVLARSRRRAVFLFQAPDVESVRLACRSRNMPLERVMLLTPDRIGASINLALTKPSR